MEGRALVAFDVQDAVTGLGGDLRGNGAPGLAVDGDLTGHLLPMPSASGCTAMQWVNAAGSIARKPRGNVLPQGMPLDSRSHLRSQDSCNAANSTIIS